MIWYIGNFIKSYVNPKLRNLFAKNRKADYVKKHWVQLEKEKSLFVVFMTRQKVNNEPTADISCEVHIRCTGRDKKHLIVILARLKGICNILKGTC